MMDQPLEALRSAAVSALDEAGSLLRRSELSDLSRMVGHPISPRCSPTA